MKLFLIFPTLVLAALSPLVCFAQADDNAAVASAIKQLEEDDEASFWHDDDGNITDVSFHENSSAEDLKLLSVMKHLTSLSTGDIDLGNDGLQHIRPLTTLKEFSTNSSKFTDALAILLADLKNLESLALAGTAVSDASIKVFAGMKELRTIHLDSTAVTADGLKALRAARPDLEILKFWNYSCGFNSGRAVLEIGRVFVLFPEKDVKGQTGFGGGGRGGGSIRVSNSREHRHRTSSSGGSSGLSSIRVSVTHEKDGAVFSIEDHTIEIRKEGTELIVDGESFPITDKYLSVTIDSNGVGKPQTHDKRPLPKRQSIFDDSE